MLKTNKTFEGARFYSLPLQANSLDILWFLQYCACVLREYLQN
jgi:hypothetical protein